MLEEFLKESDVDDIDPVNYIYLEQLLSEEEVNAYLLPGAYPPVGQSSYPEEAED